MPAKDNTSFNNKSLRRGASRSTRTERHTPEADELGRLQPQAPELESAVLGAIMIYPNAFADVSDILTPECFYDNRNAIVFTAIRTLALTQAPIDLLTVTQKLRDDGKLDIIGGPAYVAKLTQNVASAAHLIYHAKIIQQKHLARQLIEYASVIEDKAFDESTDVDNLMQEAESGLFALAEQQSHGGYKQIDPIIDEAYKQLRAAASRGTGISGVASGFPALDALTGGWQPSDLIIIAARPGMGKTAFALSMAKNMVVDYKTPVAFFSLEMSELQLVNRLVSNVCEIDGSKLKSGQLLPHEWVQFDKLIKKLYGVPLFIVDDPGLTIFSLQSEARRLVRQQGVKVIIIDYLQLLDCGDARMASRQEAVSTISRSLKRLAKELNVPVIALSQVNRESAKRGDDGEVGRRPQLTDLRESGSIEQDADIVCFIHRPEYYHLGGDNMKGIATLIVAKHRNGSVKDINLHFTARYAAFSPLEEGGGDGLYLSSASPEGEGATDNPFADGNVPSDDGEIDSAPF